MGLGLDEDPLHLDADLARVAESGGDAALGGPVQVGIGADQRRGVPPSSSSARPGAFCFSAQPTAALPVKERMRTRGSVASRSATALSQVRTWKAAGSAPAFWASSARSSCAVGACGGGLTMIGAPTASAGATLCAPRFKGKLKGTIPTTTPAGKRRTSASTPSVPASRSTGTMEPPKRLSSAAASRNTSMARCTSTRASASGLPASWQMTWAISSARLRSPATMPSSTSRRFPVLCRWSRSRAARATESA